MIQYAGTSEIHSTASAYWLPRFRGA